MKCETGSPRERGPLIPPGGEDPPQGLEGSQGRAETTIRVIASSPALALEGSEDLGSRRWNDLAGTGR